VPVEVTPGPNCPGVERAPLSAEVVVAVADLEVRVAVGTDIGYVACLVAELRSRC